MFPILSPNPEKDKDVNYIKYPIYIGANRGRGQINPTGEKTNNNAILSTLSGDIENIIINEEGNYTLIVKTNEGEIFKQLIPQSFDLIVNKGSKIKIDQQLTRDPNVGGFGQTETEIVLQSSARIYGYMFTVLVIILTQILLVIKKKQFEKVQSSEKNLVHRY
jgi:apocytochrome f